LDKDIDTGKIIMQKHFPIPEEADVEYVYDGLMKLGAQAALETINMILEKDGNVDAIDQSQFADSADKELRPAPKIFKETCRIDWNKPAKYVYDFIRGLSPYPGTWTNMNEENDKTTVLKIFKTAKTDIHDDAQPGTVFMEKDTLSVMCGDCRLEIKELQMAGKKRMDAKAFLNGMRTKLFSLE
jgi:methionyl-tRNA formyltransferase